MCKFYKILSFILAIAMVISMAPVTALGEGETPVSDESQEYVSDAETAAEADLQEEPEPEKEDTEEPDAEMPEGISEETEDGELLIASTDTNYKGSVLVENGSISIYEDVYSNNASYQTIGTFEDYCCDILDYYARCSEKVYRVNLVYTGRTNITVPKGLWNKILPLLKFLQPAINIYPDGSDNGAKQWEVQEPEEAEENVVFKLPTVRNVKSGEDVGFYFVFSAVDCPADSLSYFFGADVCEGSPLLSDDSWDIYDWNNEAVTDVVAFKSNANSCFVLNGVNLLEANGEYYLGERKPPVVWESPEAVYAGVRELIRQGKLGEKGTKFYLSTSGSFGEPDYNEVTDFYREREGMKPYEGDYLNNTLLSIRIRRNYDPDWGKYYWQFFAETITTKEQEDAVDAKVAGLVPFAGETNEAKARKAFDWVVSHVRGSGFDRYKPLHHTAYCAFIKGYGTCEAYAVAFYRLCREMGIPCKVIMGTDAGAHTYTIVKLDDGYWYYVDPSAGIWKKDYKSFSHTTEQERYREDEFVRNYISKIKNYSSGEPVAEVLDGDNTVIVEEGSLYDIKNILLDRMQEGDTSDYTIRLKKDASVKLTTNELDYSSEGCGTGAGDYSGRISVDLGGHKITVLKNEDYNICVRELKNGTISMPTNAWVIVKAGEQYLDSYSGGSYVNPYLVSNVKFAGVDGSKKQLINTDGLFLSSGVKFESSCSVTGVPRLHLQDGSEFDCDASVYALETHLSQQGIPDAGGDIIIGGTLNAGCWMNYPSRSETVIRNLTVTTGSKLFSVADIRVSGSLKLQGRTYIMNDDLGLDDNSFTSVYAPTNFWRVPDFCLYPVLEYDSEGNLVSEAKISISGILDLYNLGEISEPPVQFKPLRKDAEGTNPDVYLPGREIAAVSAKGILYANGTAASAIATGNCGEYFAPVKDPDRNSYPEIQNGVLVMEEPYRTLTFDVQGGYCEKDSKKIYLDCEYGPLPEPLRRNYTFTGWFTLPEGGEQVTPRTRTPENEDAFQDITVYAHWEEKVLGRAEKPKAYDPSGVEITWAAELENGEAVSLATETFNAEIYYTTDGSEPDPKNVCSAENPEAATKCYTEPLALADGEYTLKAVAAKAGYTDSEILTVTVRFEESYGSLEEEDIQALNAQGKTAADIPEGIWVAGLKESVPYTGKAVTMENLRVYHHNRLLKSGTDYTAAYSGNTNAGTAKITIKGKGNYTDSRIVTFEITPLSLGDYVNSGDNSEYLKVTDAVLMESGKMQKGTTSAYYRIDPEKNVYTALKAGKDFTCSYDIPGANYTAPGEYPVVLTGKGNYTGTAVFTEIILDKAQEKTLIGKLKYTAIPTQDATGGEVRPEIHIYDPVRKTELEAGTAGEEKDFTVTYFNNTEAGTASAVVTGHGNYAGTKLLTFKIAARSIGKAVLKGTLNPVTYTGEVQESAGYTLWYNPGTGEEELVNGIDYTVAYTNNINAGKNKAAIVFTGIGKYSGTLKKTFTIEARALSEVAVTPYDFGDVAYTKGGVKPAVRLEYNGKVLKEGTDYTVKYANNTAVNNPESAKKPAVTISGKGNFTGSFTHLFNIVQSSLENTGSAAASDIVYSGKAGTCKPAVTVLDSNGTKLAAGQDYDKNISYVYADDAQIIRISGKTQQTIVLPAGSKVDVKNDIISAGTELEAVITGINNYAGSEKRVRFRCVSADIGKASVKLGNPKGYTYSGKQICLRQEDLAVTVNRRVLEKGDYRIVGYSANLNKGTATVTIRGIGNYGGTKTVSFKITAKSFK